jgi:DNA-binding transcriptional ArsR family regulator
MVKRINYDLKEKIRRLWEEGKSISQIAKELGLPYPLVYYYINKERLQQRRWEKKYGELYPRMRTDWYNFISLTLIASSTLFYGILKVLEGWKFGLTHSQIVKRLRRKGYDGKLQRREKVLWELRRLKEIGLVEEYKDISGRIRYALTDKGREYVKLIEKLYEVRKFLKQKIEEKNY